MVKIQVLLNGQKQRGENKPREKVKKYNPCQKEDRCYVRKKTFLFGTCQNIFIISL